MQDDYWDLAKRIRREVKEWPAWKRGLPMEMKWKTADILERFSDLEGEVKTTTGWVVRYGKSNVDESFRVPNLGTWF